MGDALLIGAKLKANDNPEFYNSNRSEFNDGINSGFAAYPVGFRYFRGGFADRGKDVHFWGTQEAVLQNDTLGREVFSRTLSSQNSKLHRECTKAINYIMSPSPFFRHLINYFLF
jgi:hypothetical protein